MPYQDYPDGLYLLKQQSQRKPVDHYGVLDVGNRLGLPQVIGIHPVVVHQTPPTITLSWLQDTGIWTVLGRVENEASAMQRMRHALREPTYDLFGHNCEQFARYVATGKKESTQLQAAGFVVGLVALVYVAGR